MPERKRVPLVFLLDVDNTLLDNDRVKADMQAALHDLLGDEGTARFWELYEQVRKEYDVVNYPETLKRFADSWQDKEVAERAAYLINNWPYGEYLFPGTMPAIKYMTSLGEVIILSDGDDDYQPRKIANAGLTEAVGGPSDVLIYTHKETCFEDVMERVPGDHYVLVDDKERILAGAKNVMGDCLTTVWVKQGHYANDPKHYMPPHPDETLNSIGELCNLGEAVFEGAVGQ